MKRSAPRLYRAATWLYPASFRREFAADLDQSYCDLRRDRGPLATFRRITADLASSIPIQHVEVLMARTSAPAIALASGAVLFAAVAAAVVFGYPVIAAPPLLIGVAALFAYRRNQMPYRAAARDSSGMWWKFIAAGLGLFALLIVASGVHDDWDWFPWEMLILSVLLGWALIATGVLLGIVNVVRRVSRRPATG